MAKLDDIKHYFSIPVSNLKVGQPAPFDIYLYLPVNERIVHLINEGAVIHEMEVENFSGKGITTLYAHVDDRGKYYDEITPKEKVEPRSEEAELILDTLDEEDSVLTPEQKGKILSVASKKVLKSLSSMKDDPENVLTQCKEVVEDIIMVASENSEVFKEILHIKSMYPPTDHSVNTSTFSVMFALGMGYTDKDILGEVAMSALLHDVGLVQINSLTINKPEAERSEEEQAEYAKHVVHGINLLKNHKLNVSERVFKMIEQHHERFDGKGYPAGIQGFQLDDTAQLLSFANLLDNLTNGKFNGKKASVIDAFKLVDKLQKGEAEGQAFPHFFNPEFYEQLMEFLQEGTQEQLMDTSMNIVGTTQDKIGKEMDQ